MKGRWPRDIAHRRKRRRRITSLNDYPAPDLTYRDQHTPEITGNHLSCPQSIISQMPDVYAGECGDDHHDDISSQPVTISQPDGDNGTGSREQLHNLSEGGESIDPNPYVTQDGDMESPGGNLDSPPDLEGDGLEGHDFPTEESKCLRMDSGTISSLLIGMGTERMNEKWYCTVRRFLNWVSAAPENSLQLPSISSMKQSIRPLASRSIFPRIETVSFEVDMSKAGAGREVGSSLQKPVSVVKPSEWAKKDVYTRTIGGLLQKGSSSDDSKGMFSSIEDTPLVKNREAALTPFKWPWGQEMRVGHEVVISCHGAPALHDALQRHSVSSRNIETEVSFALVVRKMYVHDVAPPKVMYRVRNGQERQKISSASLPFLTGDIVLEMESNAQAGRRIYVVFRPLRRPKVADEYAMSIVFTNRDGTGPQNACKFKILKLNPNGERFRSYNSFHDAPCMGTLQDGRKYFVYRMALYADDFNAHSATKGSMGGVYMLPLGIPVDNRRGAGGIRPIGLTPPGVSTNQVLEHILDDIIEGSTRGFPCKWYDDADIVVFLDVVIFIGDYPAVSHTLDLLGHTSNVPCHLCSIERYDKSGRGATKYGYTVDINSCHPSYARSMERSLAVRAAGLSLDELRQLGMKPDKEHDMKYSSLIELGKRLCEAKGSVPMTTLGTPVVPCMFDAYRSCVVSPDHLFLGLAQDAINAVLISIPKEVRKTGETMAKHILREDGLILQNRLIDCDRRAVLSMSISAMYSFLLVAPVSYSIAWNMYCVEKGTGAELHGREKEVIGILQDLQVLISKTQYTPLLGVDGADDIHWYNDEDGSSRIHELFESAKKYIRRVDRYCGRYDPVKSPFDKPNLHRLLEFYTHSLPLLGDIRHFQELLFEGAHQPLKRAIAKSNHRNAQLQAMEHRISEDWKLRLCLESAEGGETPMEWRNEDLTTISRLVGQEPSSFSDSSFLRECVKQAFPPPVLAELRELRHRRSCYNGTKLNWELDAGVRIDYVLSEEVMKLFHGVGNSLCARFELACGTDVGATGAFVVHSYLSAKLVVRGGVSALGKPSLRYKLNRCDVIQLGGEPVPEVSDTSNPVSTGSRTFWFVHDIAQIVLTRGESCTGDVQMFPLLAVRRCVVGEDGLLRVHRQSSLQLLSLTTSVRRVLLVHHCSAASTTGAACHVNRETGGVTHSVSLEEGGCYYYFGRREGYLPRSA